MEMTFNNLSVNKLDENRCHGQRSFREPVKEESKQRPKESKEWIFIPCQRPNALVRLFCFPYAGGGTQMFQNLCQSFPVEIEICLIQLPGRDKLIGVQPIDNLNTLVEKLLPFLISYLDRPFAFWGHSMGALLGFEAARLLRKWCFPLPIHLFLSGEKAPNRSVPSISPIHNLPDDKFIEKLKIQYGFNAELLEDVELFNIFMPVLRADFKLCETYVFNEEKPLECPMTVFGGATDPTAPKELLDTWQFHTCKEFKMFIMEGDHFFPNDKIQGSNVCQRIAEVLNKATD